MTLLDDQPWRTEAACRDTPNKLFFADTGADSIRAAAEARRVCRTCPVIDHCREYALSDPDLYGIWAGLTRKQRLHIRRDRRNAAA